MPNPPVRTPRLPPGCGADLHEPLLFNPYQDAFMKARRLRFCLHCKMQGSQDENCQFTCAKCGTQHVNNLTAPRVYDRLLVLAGRGGGKTLIGAHAAREEMMQPNGIGWVMGPTYKILHDSTFPTLVRRINPEWIRRWDPEHLEITLKNGHLIAFRSLEDPERARGPHGVSWGWFDEAAQCPKRAYDVFTPTLIKAGGIIIATTTVLGFDWTYDEIEKRALLYKEPGYWACKFWTEENPLFSSNPTMQRQIDRAKASMPPDFYAQEYKAERRNAEGLVYNFATIEKQCLMNAEAVKRLIPEWPAIDPSRQILIGLDSGADHPFGATKIVVAEGGLVVVGEYLQRMQAISQQFSAICTHISVSPGIHKLTWAANKNEANLRLEFGLKNVGVVPAENKHEVGIQRVASWLHSGQLYFAYTCPKTIEQMQAYRYATNVTPSGEKKAKEAVFKFADELPDAVRYAIMAWPSLPKADALERSESQQKRWDAFDEKTRQDIERVKAYEDQEKRKELGADETGYPVGNFFGSQSSEW